MSEAGFDFLEHCRPGLELRTRDRRRARVDRVDAEGRRIHGTVEMHGACAWGAEGRFAAAPCGAAGPLDLVPPPAAPAHEQRRASRAEMLDPANRSACCD